jgi:hypothetical protein
MALKTLADTLLIEGAHGQKHRVRGRQANVSEWRNGAAFEGIE